MADQSAPPDPYGIDVRISDRGDLVVSPSGGLTDITGPENCAQALVLRARCYPGELPLQMDYGSNLAARLIGQKSLDADLARAQTNVELRAIVESDRRFLAARDVSVRDVTQSGDRLSVSLRLELAGGQQLAVGDLANVRIDEITGSSVVDPTLLDGSDIDAVDDFAFLADDLDDLNELPDLESFLSDTSGDDASGEVDASGVVNAD